MPDSECASRSDGKPLVNVLHRIVIEWRFVSWEDAMLAEQYRQEEDLPITDELFADVVGDQTRLFALMAKVSSDKRALLAMYCYRRSHLNEIGLAIAATCDEDELTYSGGRAGADLFSKSRQRPQPEATIAHQTYRRKITLSRGHLRETPALD
jgi:hypothetical protein